MKTEKLRKALRRTKLRVKRLEGSIRKLKAERELIKHILRERETYNEPY